jgi:hypothetical protein
MVALEYQSLITMLLDKTAISKLNSHNRCQHAILALLCILQNLTSPIAVCRHGCSVVESLALFFFFSFLYSPIQEGVLAFLNYTSPSYSPTNCDVSGEIHLATDFSLSAPRLEAVSTTKGENVEMWRELDSWKKWRKERQTRANHIR